MATYTDITVDDFITYLAPQGFKPVALPGVRELVLAKRVDQDGVQLSLRVYTGVDPDGHSRDVGEDAIRAVLFSRTGEGVVRKVATSKRVHRVQGWKRNLQARLDDLKVERICPDCGSPMARRKGKRGEFFGCTNRRMENGRWVGCGHVEDAS